MKAIFWGCLTFFSGCLALAASGAEQDAAMSDAYWQIWNPEVQARIDRDIEQHRKADGRFKIDGLAPGTDVKVEQLSHDFFFGAHIFNFNQLGTTQRNRKYKELYGTLFNSATIAFYWKKFEMEPGKPRFKQAEWDTEEYWNNVAEPKEEAHWRRPATDPVVGFCESKGIRLHGHTIIWGNRKWQHPAWLFDEFFPADEKEKLLKSGQEGLAKLTPAEIAELAPTFTRELRRLFEKRVVELAEHYDDRLHSWDVVNESATDFARGAPGEPTISGLFTRDMEPKPSFHALNELINDEWKTRTTVKAGDDGAVAFRGFKGRYRLSWTDAAGNSQQTEVHVGEEK